MKFHISFVEKRYQLLLLLSLVHKILSMDSVKAALVIGTIAAMVGIGTISSFEVSAVEQKFKIQFCFKVPSSGETRCFDSEAQCVSERGALNRGPPALLPSQRIGACKQTPVTE